MIQILFATQTGNSEFYAEEVGRHLNNAIVSSIEDFDFLTLPEQKRVIFIISTTGDGDMTNDILKFWSFLLIKDLPKESLIKLEFTVFGLGDSSYPKFNYAARKLRSRLLQLSAKEFILQKQKHIFFFHYFKTLALIFTQQKSIKCQLGD